MRKIKTNEEVKGILCDGGYTGKAFADGVKALLGKVVERSFTWLEKHRRLWKNREPETTLRTSIYFADIHSPWQRGPNENINGCLRFFLTRGMDFRNLEDGYLETVVSLLNDRPGKCLGLKSPHEFFCCT